MKSTRTIASIGSKLAAALLLNALVFHASFAHRTEKLVVLPFQGNGVDAQTAQTLTSLLRSQLDRSGKFLVVEAGQTPAQACADLDCAVGAASPLNAAKVVFGDVSKLGSKYIVNFALGDVASKKRVTGGERVAWSVEDLQGAVESAARNIVGLSDETTIDGRPAPIPNRVINKKYDTVSIGVGFGQMYTQNGYPGGKTAFALDGRISLEYPTYAFNFLGAIRKGLILNLGASYLFSRSDICPYVSGSLGYHLNADFEYDPYYNSNDEYVYSGFDVMAGVGVLLLRTGNLRGFVNADYMYTTNPAGIS